MSNEFSVPEELRGEMPVAVAGIAGIATMEAGGYAFTAKWASHTGYRHTFNANDDPQVIAQELYDEQASLCYLVGDEHKEFGWKTVQINHDGLVQIRLPQWAGVVVTESLEHMGIELHCPFNCYWVFPAGVSLEQARDALQPLLNPSTRLIDEYSLAMQLKKHFITTEMGFNKTQLSLF
jgi:hypothetical protein